MAATLLERARDIKQERQRLVVANRELVDRAETESRDFSPEEQQEYDKRWDDIATLTQRAERLEKQDEAERDMGAPEPRHRPTDEKPEKRNGAPAEYRYKTEPKPGVPAVERVFPLHGTEEERQARRERFRASLFHPEDRSEREHRALQAATDTAGGYTYPDEQWVAELIKFVDDNVLIRGLATVMMVENADSLGVPTLENDPADPTWTSELAIGSEDSTMSFGKRELNPSPNAEYIKVSRTLMRRSRFNIESLVRERLAYKASIAEEKAFMTGDGANEPLGVFTAISGAGITTSRDVSTDNTGTEFTFDGLKNAKYNQKSQYWPRLRWIFHRDGVKLASKLKDGEGQYQWQSSLVGGEPDRLLGFPVLMSEYAPNTFTSGLYVGLLGDFSFYWIADAMNVQIQRLDELYAATNQVGFILRHELDGMAVLEEAFTRVKLG